MGQDEPLVRQATADDADEVARLLHDFNTEFDTLSPGAEVLAAPPRVLLAGHSTVAILARTPAVAVALMTCEPTSGMPARLPLLDELYVDPRLRGQGIGSAIIRSLTTISRERGVDLIEINVDEGDVEAQRSYERHGFSAMASGSTERAFSYSQELAT